jgi:hypothetical protein
MARRYPRSESRPESPANLPNETSPLLVGQLSNPIGQYNVRACLAYLGASY